MSEVKYFVYLGEASYSKIASDKSAVYQFKAGQPIAVSCVEDQMKFAGRQEFLETDKNGKPVENSNLPTNNGGPNKPLSYVSMPNKKKDVAASVATPSVPKEDAEEPAKRTSTAKKKSKKE